MSVLSMDSAISFAVKFVRARRDRGRLEAAFHAAAIATLIWMENERHVRPGTERWKATGAWLRAEHTGNAIAPGSLLSQNVIRVLKRQYEIAIAPTEPVPVETTFEDIFERLAQDLETALSPLRTSDEIGADVTAFLNELSRARDREYVAGLINHSRPTAPEPGPRLQLPLPPDYPRPPFNYVRPASYETAKRTLLDLQVNRTGLIGSGAAIGMIGSGAATGMIGLPGVGKSAMATVLAADEDVHRAFPDGVMWITVGRGRDPVDVLREALGRLRVEAAWDTLSIGRNLLAEATASLRILMVVDDVWSAPIAELFTRLGPDCRLLITTRIPGVLDSIQAARVDLDPLELTQAIDLLTQRSGSGGIAPAKILEAVAAECGNIPVALLMASGMVHGGRTFEEVVERLKSSDISRLQAVLPDYQHTDLLSVLQVSIDDLEETEPDVYECFLDCAVFPEDAPVPEAALSQMWAPRIDRRDVGSIADKLVGRQLVDRGESGAYRFHDLFYDYLVQTTANSAELHKHLVNSYSESCDSDWRDLDDDGYVFGRLAWHISESEGEEGVRKLLLDPGWVEARIAHGGPAGMVSDCRILSEDPVVSRLTRVIVLSSNVVGRDADQLHSQMRARISVDDADLGQLTRALSASASKPQLFSSAPFLPGPDGALIRTLEGHMGTVNGLSVLPDGLRAVSGSFDSTARLWDLETGETIRTFEGHTGSVTTVLALPDGLRVMSGSADNTVRLWDLETGETIRTFEGHTGAVFALATLPDGLRAITGGGDNIVRLWDLETGEMIQTFEGHTDAVFALSVIPDGLRALSGSRDQIVRLWDLETGLTIQTFEGHTGSVYALAALPDGLRAVSGSRDHTVRVWDLEMGETIRTLEGHTDSVTAVSALPDGLRAVSGSVDYAIRLWDLKTGETIWTLEGHTRPISALSTFPDGQHAVSGSFDDTIRVWDLEMGETIRTLEGHTDPVTAVSAHPDGLRAVSGSADNIVRLWDLETGETIRTFEGHTNVVTALSVLPDGERMVSGSRDNTVRLWDLETGETIRTFEGHTDIVTALSVLPDGERMVSGSRDNTVRLWDLETGETIRTIEGHTDDIVTALSVLPDGERVVSGSWYNIVRLWDLETGETIRTFEGHTDIVTALSVLPDGKRVVSGSRDNTVRLWDLETGETIRKLEGHTDAINALFALSDGLRVVSGSRDHTIRLWDLDKGSELVSLNHEDNITKLTRAPTGDRLVAGLQSGMLVTIDIAIEDDGPHWEG